MKVLRPYHFALVACIFVAVSASAQTETILHFFGSADAFATQSAVTLDSAGNIYGTLSGGAYGMGGVYMLSPTAGGSWSLTLLHSFGGFPDDGIRPGGGVARDAAGNLFGTTQLGGYYGFGTVYELSPSAGTWSYKIIRGFTNRNGEGYGSVSTPVVDAAGNVYGTTPYSGNKGEVKPGSVWELSPQPDGSWPEKILHVFTGYPDAGTTLNVIFGPDGNLYGASVAGGLHANGAVFQLSPTPSGSWTESLLYSLGRTLSDDGRAPSGMAFDSAGNIFVATLYGGHDNQGAVFELPSNGDGTWGAQVKVHSFSKVADGDQPAGSPAIDASGNVYVITTYGDNGFGNGGLFKFTNVAGAWTETPVHAFGATHDGWFPMDGPVLDPVGNLYGTTFIRGGQFDEGDGTLWRITP